MNIEIEKTTTASSDQAYDMSLTIGLCLSSFWELCPLIFHTIPYSGILLKTKIMH